MGQRVLVVDDEKLIVKGIRFSLEQDNMEVDCAYDGEEALEKLRANEYDMVLLDIMLPGEDGYSILEKLPKAMIWTRSWVWSMEQTIILPNHSIFWK